jgi:hypothetical protein
MCYISGPFIPPPFTYTNDIWWTVQTMKNLLTHLTPSSSSGVPRNFIRGGFNKFSWGQRQRGSGGSGPLVRGSGGSCNLVQQISFSKIFLIFGICQNFGISGGGGLNPPKLPLGTPLSSSHFLSCSSNILLPDNLSLCSYRNVTNRQAHCLVAISPDPASAFCNNLDTWTVL